MNVYDARWNNAKGYIERVLQVSEQEHLFVMFDGEMFTDSFIEIDDENRKINIVSPGCSINIFNGDPDYDEGAHTPVNEWIADIKTRLRVFQEVYVV